MVRGLIVGHGGRRKLVVPERCLEWNEDNINPDQYSAEAAAQPAMDAVVFAELPLTRVCTDRCGTSVRRIQASRRCERPVRHRRHLQCLAQDRGQPSELVKIVPPAKAHFLGVLEIDVERS